MLALSITLLLQASSVYTSTVSKDKARDKKTVEVVLMVSDVINPETSQVEINRLIINSTYDDSFFISAYLRRGVNVTVVQDRKADVSADVNVNSPQLRKDIVSQLEQSARRLMRDDTMRLEEAVATTRRLLEIVSVTKNPGTTHQNRLRIDKLQEELNLYLEKIVGKIGDKRLKDEIATLRLGLKVEITEESTNRKLDEVAKLVREHAKQTKDIALGKLALQTLEAYAEKKKHSMPSHRFLEAFANISKVVRENLFTPANASLLRNQIEKLHELQPTNRVHKSAVKSLEQEIMNLAEAINVIEAAREALRLNANEYKIAVNTTVSNLKRELAEIANTSGNKLIKKVSEQLLAELQQKANSDVYNWMEILDRMNETLNDAKGFGGKAGLGRIEAKLNSLFMSAVDKDVKFRAMEILSAVKFHEKKIERAWKIFDNIERNIRVPKNDVELRAFERSIGTIGKLASTVNDPSVSALSKKLVSRIQELTDDYRMNSQIDGINRELRKMSRSLETAETGEEIKTDEQALNLLESGLKKSSSEPAINDKLSNILSEITDVRRKIPEKAKKIELKSEENELRKIVYGYLRDASPELKLNLKKVLNDSQVIYRMSKGEMNMEGLKDRIRIAANDYKRIKIGLNELKTELSKYLGGNEAVDDITPYKGLKDTAERLQQLNHMNEVPETSGLLTRMVRISQNVQHANETLKQLQKMIKLNTKLLNSAGASAVKDFKLTEVPINKVSLHPLVSTEPGKTKVAKNATEASDLDKTFQDDSAINSEAITAPADDDDDVE